VLKSVLLADLKASKKTYRLYKEMQQNFDAVYLSQNHSKVVLVQNDEWTVTVISSQNQTYGDRAECTMVTTSQQSFLELFSGLKDLIDKQSIEVYGEEGRNDVQSGAALPDREAGRGHDEPFGDFFPIGV
jgi:HKD family nuclease